MRIAHICSIMRNVILDTKDPHPDKPRPTPLQARLAGMWASGMSPVAIRRALGLSEAEAMMIGIFPPRAAGRTGQPRPGPGSAPGTAAGPVPPRGPRMDAVIDAVARESGVGRAVILGHGQSRASVRARQLAMHLLRGLCPGASLSTIGHALGRDHSTVLHGLRRAEARLADDTGFRSLRARVCARLERGLV
jgi:DNA-binding CsgD family transcriptional regulator